MEEDRELQSPEPEASEAPEPGYVSRPAWQVWAARVALVLFIAFVIYQLLTVAGGGR